ncbi:hypothetical protein [uncultured Psychroserpens sp.]|uniref:hypothetical protein n=1 Tax=uncultured Psychroserpens sp. TaxID=255436 RepID=UPI00261FE62C|nr:hypothetical protein [uncultured Psychroserpens sp.]
MIKSIFLTTMALMLSLSATAQDPARQNLTSPGLIYAFDLNDNSIIGTPYIENDFMPGKISADKDGKLFSLRYNAFSDVMEIKKDNNDIEALNKDLLNVTITFSKGNKAYRAYNYVDSDTKNGKRGYFVVLSDASSKKPLLAKEVIKFTEKKKASSSYAKTKPAQYKRKDDVYYTLNDKGIAIKIPSKKKDIAKAFPKHSKAILDFIKSNKIKTSKKEDLMKLVDYINTL